MSNSDRWSLACLLFGLAGILSFIAVLFVLATP